MSTLKNLLALAPPLPRRKVRHAARIGVGTRRRFWVQAGACLFFVLALAASSRAQSCSSCAAGPSDGASCQTEVPVGFNGVMCADTGFSITLNGASVSGTGSSCQTYSPSNKNYTNLKVDKVYTITAGSNLCSTHINFDVPDGYTLFVNDKETTTIDKGNIYWPGDGDGSWDIVVRAKCPCGEDGAGDSSGPGLGSVFWEVGLGRLPDGGSAEHISIRESALSAAIYTPAVLIYSPPALNRHVDVVRNPDESLRQVKTPQALADIVVIGASEYDINFYAPAAVGAKVGGLYTFTGQPFVTWKIKNPNSPAADRLQISETRNGVTETSEYHWDAATGTWTLTTGGGERVETSTQTHPTAETRVETVTVRNGASQVVSKVARTYQLFVWGEALVQEVVDPDGAALTTTYTYYDEVASWELGRTRKVRTVTYPDGSWELYDYIHSGKKGLVLRPWKGLPQTAEEATLENSHATIYGFANEDGSSSDMEDNSSYHYTIPASIEEQVLGARTGFATLYRTRTTVNGQIAVRTEETAYAAASAGQKMVVTKYHSTANPFLANRVASVEHPDGRRDTYYYERGNYTTNADPALNQFTPNIGGAAERETIVHGTANAVNGVPLKSTKETTVRDQFGNVALQETYVYTGTAFERVAWSAMDYDGSGHLTRTSRHTGQVSTSTWVGDRKTADVDEAGVETVYTYDALGRVGTSTRKGVAAGAYPAQPDIVVTHTYDAEGRRTGEAAAAGGLSLATSAAYDVAGRITRQTDEAGLDTLYAYAFDPVSGVSTETVTQPGGATQITATNRDGRTKSVTGTAVVARHFDYGVHTDGTLYTAEHEGSAGLSSPRWTKSYADWLGRKVRIETPAFAGPNVVRAYSYDAGGRLRAESVTAGAKLRADRLYVYDELGNQYRAGLDIDASGDLKLASIDRITDAEAAYEKTGGDWFRVTTVRNYFKANDATPTARAVKERLNNFPAAGADKTFSETTEVDEAGILTRTSSSVDRAAKKITKKIDPPDSALDEVSVGVNGLLQTSSPSTPEAATTYSYDALGRPAGRLDSQAGATGKAYHPATGQLLSESDAVQTTSYDYYPAADLNAGRLKSRTDGHGRKTYYAYGSRGEILRTWGESARPVEYVYDDYGQMRELRTFRDGTGWPLATWPAATTGPSDVTLWTYHEPTGALTHKRDAAAKETAYTYDALNRVKTRTWARTGAGGAPLTTAYTYDVRAGDLTLTNYSDATPDVTRTYDRGQRVTHITDAAGTRAFTYHAGGALQSEQFASGLLDGVRVGYGYDTYARRNSLQASRGATSLLSQSYTYDAHARAAAVTSGAQTATYSYHPTTGLISNTGFTGGAGTARTYDALGRLSLVTNSSAPGVVTASYKYAYNRLHQRTRVTREDGSYWLYNYNDRGELTAGKKYWADNAAVAGQQAEFSYDNFGNRRTSAAGGDAQGGSLRPSTYTANALNQYAQRTVPGAVDVTGSAAPGAVVTVNNAQTYRRGDYYQTTLALDNSLAPVYAPVSVVGVRANVGGGGEDAVTQQGGNVYLTKAVELSAHDDDGNLVADGLWGYTWDAENRLVGVESAAAVPPAGRRKFEHAYDYLNRRILKKSFVWNTTTGSYQLRSVTRFVYDGWNLIAELDASNAPVRSFTWGLDVSGEWQAAGGVGGLLLIREGGNTYQAGYDGNGNVASLVKAGTVAPAASYDYDPFGVSLKSTGEYAARNPFRFSTKYTDEDTGLVYYGHRYYNPQTGKWLSKDPLEEEGGANLYSFSENDAVGGIDYLGLKKRGNGHHIIPWSLFNGKVSDAVFEFFNSDAARIFNEHYKTHGYGTVNGVKHSVYNRLVKEELEKFLGRKSLRRMTLDEAKEFLRRIKRKSGSHAISRFNAGIAEEAATAVRLALTKNTRKAAASSLLRTIRAGGKRGKKGLPYIGTILSAYFFAEDAYANGIERAVDHEVRDTAGMAESFVNSMVQIWERGTIQKYGRKLVDLCDISDWW